MNRIDRGGQKLTFHFDGVKYQGIEGDTLAAALIANRVKIVGRSFKTHRARGIIAAGVEDTGGIVQVGSGAHLIPNARATQIDLYEGLVARSVNCWPNAKYDVSAVLGLFGRFLIAGFYYKTFKWPNWHFYDRFIRRAAGLGKAPTQADPDCYTHKYAHCDVLVVGGGPAGLKAALEAVQRGERVILADDQNEFGGSFLWERGEDMEWVRRTVEKLSTAILLTRSVVSGYYDHNMLTISEQLGGGWPKGAFLACARRPGGSGDRGH